MCGKHPASQTLSPAQSNQTKIELSTTEQQEYSKVLEALISPRFHHRDKCGTMETRIIEHHYSTKRSFLTRLYCYKHELLVSKNGWQIGFMYGQESALLNEEARYFNIRKKRISERREYTLNQ